MIFAAARTFFTSSIQEEAELASPDTAAGRSACRSGSLRIFSGVFAATSSMSMPPAGLTMNTGFFDARSRMMPTYASLAMSAAGVTSTFCTVSPLICMPRIGRRPRALLPASSRASRRRPCRGRRRAPAPSPRPCRRCVARSARPPRPSSRLRPAESARLAAQDLLRLIFVDVHSLSE